MRVLAAAMFAALAVATVLASPQDVKKKPDNSRMMVVKGCVNGATLEVHHEDLGRGDLSAPYDRFRLHGNKDLMHVLTKQLNGHLVEVSGIVNDPAGKQGMGKTIPVGSKTTVTVNARDVPRVPDPATDPIMNVDSFKDLERNCSGK